MIGTTVTATIAAFRASIDAIRAAVKARDDRLVEAILQEMNSKISSVQAAYMALQEKHAAMTDSEREAKNELRKMKEQLLDFSQYEPCRTAQGGLVYRQKEPTEIDQLPVDLCANCVTVGVKTYLQPVSDGVSFFLHCNTHGDVPADKPSKVFAPRKPMSERPLY